VWKNRSAGLVALQRLGDYGRTRTELVHGGRVFHITPQERRMNQNQVAVEALDPFTNGMLGPIHLVDGEVDTELLRANPNTFEDSDIQKLFKIKGEAFAARLEEVTSLAALDRFVELAREPRFGVTVHQYEMVKARQAAIKAHEVEVNSPAEQPDRKPRAVTPK
jgi:hypothetical protein